MATYELTAKNADVVRALKILKKAAGRKRVNDMVLLYADGTLTFKLSFGEAGVLAQGSWPKPIRLSGAGLLGMVTNFPDIDPLVFSYDSKYMRFARIQLRAFDQFDSPEQPWAFAPNADFMDNWNAYFCLSKEELASKGLDKRLELMNETRLSAVKKALAHVEQYGVSEEELDSLVMAALKRRCHI